MKKLVSLLLAACMCFSVGVTLAACGDGSKDKSESTEREPKTTVTLDEWNKAFEFGENWTLVCVAEMGEEIGNATLKRDGNKFYGIIKTLDASGNILFSDEEYGEISGGMSYWISLDEEMNKYEKVESDIDFVEDFACDFIPNGIQNFNDYQYDEEEKAYVADSISFTVSDTEEDFEYNSEVIDLVLRFEDGKIVSFSYIRYEAPYDIKITYGNAVVTLPVVD